MTKEEILALRPRKLTFARIADIEARTGEDVYSPAFAARINKPGIGNALNLMFVMLAPELQAAKVSRDEFANAFDESTEAMTPVIHACAECLTAFFQSQAPKENPPQETAGNGGLGATPTESEPLRRSKK